MELYEAEARRTCLVIPARGKGQAHARFAEESRRALSSIGSRVNLPQQLSVFCQRQTSRLTSSIDIARSGQQEGCCQPHIRSGRYISKKAHCSRLNLALDVHIACHRTRGGALDEHRAPEEHPRRQRRLETLARELRLSRWPRRRGQSLVRTAVITRGSRVR